MPNTLTSEYWIGDNPIGDCILESPLRLENGYLETPDGAGLGIAVREDVLFG
jgi:L-alanine-DL-glutamate epimerase-like enolase superfamily enzyme